MPLEPGAFQRTFSGTGGHVEGPGSGPITPRPSGALPEMDKASVSFVVEQLKVIRVKLDHAGWNPFPWIRKFRPEGPEDVAALMGLAHDLMDPELSPTDLENIARDIIRENRVAKFFIF